MRIHWNTPETFWARVNICGPNECWVWQGSRSSKGYGDVSYQASHMRAHRVAYMLTYGDPGSLCVRHTCDNPPCCNPAHLLVGTQQLNVDDMISRGRGRKAFGMAHFNARLDAARVLDIRGRYAVGVTIASIARDLNLSEGCVRHVVKRRTWKHVS